MRLSADGVSFVVDLVVLDKDGTMFELDEIWATLAATWEDQLETATGIAGLASAIASRIGHDRLTGEVAFGGVLAAGTMQQLRDAIGEVIAAFDRDPAAIDSVVVPDAGAPTPKGDLRGWLSRARELGTRIAVLTSDDRSASIQHLQGADVHHLVDDIVAGDDEIPPKPDPTGLLALCASCGARPGRTVMIGDSPGDMEAAAAAGTHRIGIRSPGGEALPGADVVVASLDEIELLA